MNLSYIMANHLPTVWGGQEKCMPPPPTPVTYFKLYCLMVNIANFLLNSSPHPLRHIFNYLPAPHLHTFKFNGDGVWMWKLIKKHQIMKLLLPFPHTQICFCIFILFCFVSYRFVLLPLLHRRTPWLYGQSPFSYTRGDSSIDNVELGCAGPIAVNQS